MRLPHITPFAKAPIYFFTACVAARRPLLAAAEPSLILREVWQKSAVFDGWFVGRYVIMPDHVHSLLVFPTAADMSRVVGDWKRFTARKLGVLWQTNYFDHRVRDHHKLQEAAVYIRRNPVAKGLCVRAEDWPWVWPVQASE